MADLIEQKITDFIKDTIVEMGYNLVRVKIFDREERILQIMAERKSDKDLNVDDCAKISYAISTILDVEDPMSGEYNLEVSSPGIDRPLVTLQDFKDYTDYDARINTLMPTDGRKKYRGYIKGVDEDDNVLIKLSDQKEDSVIPFNNIESSKLVLTDELLRKLKT